MVKNSKRIFLSTVFFICGLICFSQNPKIDSLRRGLASSKNDSVKLQFTLSLFNYFRNVNTDSAINYAEKGIVYSQKIKQAWQEALFLNSIGALYFYKGDYERSLNFALKCSRLIEPTDDSGMKASVFNGIGLLYMEMKRKDKAFIYFTKALDLRIGLKDTGAIGQSYLSLGNYYEGIPDYKNALSSYEQSYEYMKLGRDKRGQAMALNNIGLILIKLSDTEKGLLFLKSSLSIHIELESHYDLADTYVNIADLYASKKDFTNALDNYNKSFYYAELVDAIEIKKDVYIGLSSVYEKMGNFKLSLDNHKLYSTLKDTIFNEKNIEQMHEMQEKFETDKKEKEIVILNKDKLLKNKEIKEHKTVQNYLFIVIALVALFLGFVFRAFKQKQKANTIITLQKEEVEKAKKLIELQKEIVEEKQTEILDSIHYAQRIQKALLASKTTLNENLNGDSNNFVYFKPKDIVSGDFYWATSVTQQTFAGNQQSVGNELPTDNCQLFYLAVCDSTGHGVPGAFMSLLNIGFLSEAIKEKKIYEPNKILDYVRKRLIESISSEGQKDGFDGILICINRTTKQITYAAANNSPVLVSPSGLNYLYVDKMPVGQGEKMDGFQLNTINYNNGDILYLFTDGLADQFGGPKGKKFKYKQLEEILFTNSSLPLNQQVQILNQRFEEWKGKLEQVDDVLLIGIRV